MPHKDPEQARAYHRRWAQDNPASAAAKYRKRDQHRTAAIQSVRAEFMERQRGLCPCGDPLPLGSRLALDHDHGCCSGVTAASRACRSCDRGVMHLGCNTVLGMVNDDPQRLRSLAGYLERWQARKQIDGQLTLW